MSLQLPKSRREIDDIQRVRKRHAVEQARRAQFYKKKLDHIDLDKLDDPNEWRKIPILDKDMLRSLSDRDFYDGFCLKSADGIAEYWRSGGSTGVPLFYPRSFTDLEYALLSFARAYACAGCKPGGVAHVSFPLGIHPVGHLMARAAGHAGIAAKLGRGRNDDAFAHAIGTHPAPQAQHLDGHEQLWAAPRQPG